MLRFRGRFPSAIAGLRVIQPKSHKAIVFYSHKPDFTKGFNIAAVQPVMSPNEIKSEDVSQLIPHDMQPGNDASQVASRILDRSLNSWMNSPMMKGSSLVKTAKSFENTMGSNVSVGGDDPEQTKHSIQFNVRAEQARAFVKYEGITNAQLSYQVGSDRVDLEVREPMTLLETDLVYNHTNSRADSRDIVSVRWIW